MIRPLGVVSNHVNGDFIIVQKSESKYFLQLLATNILKILFFIQQMIVEKIAIATYIPKQPFKENISAYEFCSHLPNHQSDITFTTELKVYKKNMFIINSKPPDVRYYVHVFMEVGPDNLSSLSIIAPNYCLIYCSFIILISS